MMASYFFLLGKWCNSFFIYCVLYLRGKILNLSYNGSKNLLSHDRKMLGFIFNRQQFIQNVILLGSEKVHLRRMIVKMTANSIIYRHLQYVY